MPPLFQNFKEPIITAFIVGLLLGGALVYASKGSGYFNFLSAFSAGELEESALHLQRSLPLSIRVPAVGIEASFEAPVALDSFGRMEVPEGYDTVAWYEFAPTPGELGPSVVLGHVDSESGPKVFHPLKDVNEGDIIEVTREDGTVAVFEAYKIKYYRQTRFPMQDVFGDTDGAEIRLITCSGIFDHATYRYSHNLVVYGKLLEVK